MVYTTFHINGTMFLLLISRGERGKETEGDRHRDRERDLFLAYKVRLKIFIGPNIVHGSHFNWVEPARLGLSSFSIDLVSGLASLGLHLETDLGSAW